MFDHDKLIINIFFNENNKLSNNYWKFIIRIKKNKYDNIKNYLLNRFDDLSINSKTILKESLYRILNNVEHRLKCPICGKYTKFNPLKLLCYNDHCSTSCEMKDNNVINKHNQTCLEKYGSVNNIKKTKKTKKNKYGDENYNNTIKRNNTNLEKYGNICSLHNEKIKEKTIDTNIKKYGTKYAQSNNLVKEKIRNSNIKTCKDKYGVDNIMKTDFAKQHQKETLQEKYGVNNISQSQIIKENIKEIVIKRNHTKRKNNSFNTSIPEQQSFELIKEKYPNVIYQYKSKLYPFDCDFYIPELDLYIECNYHWTHGKHYYDSNNIDDQKTLKLWKSKNTKFYNNAIKTWTDLDIRKRNIAKENNINYLVFWNIEELKKWLDNYDNCR